MVNEPVLDRVSTPADLKRLAQRELDPLAKEVRDLIIETTSHTGGHLASSLGAVEISIALLRALDTPRDRVVWDVGHQAYSYKILTGRREDFHSLRQYGGISGFPRRSESEYDVVDSGHAGSSISYGLGLALARDALGDDYKVAVVIGDGSMTSGVAYEAMNQAGHHLSSNLIIVLNDNGMSISSNVGGFSSYLSRIRIRPGYTHMKEEFEEVLKTLPALGDGLIKLAGQFKESFTHALVPGMLFESLGLKYVGPIDGHDIPLLEETFKQAAGVSSPVLIHVITRKGMGYDYSEKKPERFHGVSSFDSATGKMTKNRDVTYTEVFGDAVIKVARDDTRVVAITAAMKLGTGLDPFSKMFPDRFLDVGIAEQFAVNVAGGLALGGLRPIVVIYSTFLQRAFDQLSQEICLQRLPVVFVIDRAGLVGEDGATHHGYFDLSYLRMLPNMTVMAPGEPREFEPMLRFAMEMGSPVALRFPRGKARKVARAGRKKIEVGRGEVVSRGKDVALLAIGDMLPMAAEIAVSLSGSGVDASVVNARFVKPLDAEFLADVAGGKRLLVTIEDNVVSGGFGSAVLELLNSAGIRVPVLVKGLPDRYVDHGKISELMDEVGLTAEKVTSEIVRTLDAG